jgi:zinc transport system permease protein
MPFPFDRDYMQLALLAGLVVGVSAPMIGSFLVQKRMSLIGDGIGHVAFAGVAGGLLLGVWPVWTALVAAVAGALAIELLRTRGRASGDLALALLFYAGIAGGVVLLGLGQGLSANVFVYLFGSILTVTAADVTLIAVIGLVIVVTVTITRRALLAVVTDEEWAQVAGIPVAVLNAVLAVLAAVTVVAAMRVVGILLIAALMVLPVGAGQILGRSFRGTLLWSMGVAVVSVVLGLAAARVWGLAPGGTIVLISGAVFALLSGGAALRRPERLPAIFRGGEEDG